MNWTQAFSRVIWDMALDGSLMGCACGQTPKRLSWPAWYVDKKLAQWTHYCLVYNHLHG